MPLEGEEESGSAATAEVVVAEVVVETVLRGVAKEREAGCEALPCRVSLLLSGIILPKK